MSRRTERVVHNDGQDGKKTRQQEREPLQLLIDLPSLSPGLGFPEFAAAISDAIRGTAPSELSIGIYGDWGSGKSTLLRAIQRDLDQHGFRCIHFDAWRHERAPHIVLPLLATVHSQLGSDEKASPLRGALERIMKGVQINLGPVSIEPAALTRKSGFSATAYYREYVAPLDALIDAGSEYETEKIVVLIDDLDRCSPGSIVDLIESINLILNIPGFAFVVALDYSVLISAIESQYPHVSGHKFVDKLFQLSFRVPPLDFARKSAVRELTGGKDLADIFDQETAERLGQIAQEWLQGNPRAIKRLLNNHMLLYHMNRDFLSPTRSGWLVALLAMDLLWPTEWEDMKRRIIHSREDPENLLSALPDEAPIRRFCSKMFESWPPKSDLLQLLNMSSIVEETSVEDPEKTSPRKNRNLPIQGDYSFFATRQFKDIAEVLVRYGFKLENKYPELFYHSIYANVRVVIMPNEILLQTADLLPSRGRELPSVNWHDSGSLPINIATDMLSVECKKWLESSHLQRRRD